MEKILDTKMREDIPSHIFLHGDQATENRQQEIVTFKLRVSFSEK